MANDNRQDKRPVKSAGGAKKVFHEKSHSSHDGDSKDFRNGPKGMKSGKDGARNARPWEKDAEKAHGDRPWEKNDRVRRSAPSEDRRREKKDEGEFRGSRGDRPWEKKSEGEYRGNRNERPWEKKDGAPRPAPRGDRPWDKKGEGEHRGPRGERPWEQKDGAPRPAPRKDRPWEKMGEGERRAPRGDRPWDKKDGAPRPAPRGDRPMGKPEGAPKRPFGEHDSNRGPAPEPAEHVRPVVRPPRPPRPAEKAIRLRPQEQVSKVNCRDVALNALRNVTQDNAYAAQALDRELDASSLSDADRRLAASIFYSTLENRLRIEHMLMKFMAERPLPMVMDILAIAVAQVIALDKIPDHAAVDEAVKQAKRLGYEAEAPMVNGVLRNLLRARDAGQLELPNPEEDRPAFISEKYSVARELVDRMIQAYGEEETEKICAWKPQQRIETVRPNRLQMTDSEFEAYLNKAGIPWERGVVSGAYRIKDVGRAAALEGYATGKMSIQGETSMLAAYAVRPKAGMQILDACAAPGGKTMLMAEMMKGVGRVYAWDLHEHRVELIKSAVRRLGLDNVRAHTQDATDYNENLEGEMDAVLVDVPCSGLGVMGEKPDIKYRLAANTITALVPIQASILNTCAHYVRYGGRLVYSTCTILPEENENQVRAFLEKHPDFEMDPDARFLPEELRPYFVNGCIQILPSRDGLDGFFIAVMKRKAL